MEISREGEVLELTRLHQELAAEYDLTETAYTFGTHSFSFLSVLDSSLTLTATVSSPL